MAERKKKPRHRFDFPHLEALALNSWVTWDKNDTVENRTDMYNKIFDLTFACICAGGFEKKFKIRLGSDPTADVESRMLESSADYSVYLFERIITRSRSFHPKEERVEIMLNPGDELDPERVAMAVKKTVTHKQPVVVQKIRRSCCGLLTEVGKPCASCGQLTSSGNMFTVDYKHIKFALQPYISQNLLHILLGNHNDYGTHELLETLEATLQEGGDGGIDLDRMETAGDRFTSGYLAKRVLRALVMFYPMSEIRRLFAISCEMINRNHRGPLDIAIPKDVRDFSVVLIGVTKRIAREHSTVERKRVRPKRDFKQALETAVRSSVFMSSVASNKAFDRELLLSLDLESLYRLSTLMGGKTIRVPTLRDIESLVGGVSAICDVLIEGKDPDKALKGVKEELGLVFSHRINLKNFVHQALESYSIFGEDKDSQTLFTLLLGSIACLDKTFEGLALRSEEASVGELAASYKAMVECCARFTDSMVKMSETGKKLLSGVIPADAQMVPRNEPEPELTPSAEPTQVKQVKGTTVKVYAPGASLRPKPKT